MDRNLALEFVRVTEVAAIAAAKWVGKGDGKAADQDAVDEMRLRFNDVAFSGTVVIGEGLKDEAAHLYVGEQVGAGNGVELDIAVDPLECTDSVANGKPNAISVIATAPKGAMLQGPDTYMNKLAVGPEAAGKVHLEDPVDKTLKTLSKTSGKALDELMLIVMDRPRNAELISQIRSVGARVQLIQDGDVAGAIAPSLPHHEVDALMGIGASAETVLAAAALKTLGGEIQGKWWFEKHPELKDQVTDPDKVLFMDDFIASDQCTFTATGVISGPLLRGIDFVSHNHAHTHSVVMRSQTKTIRWISAEHLLT